MPLSPAQPRSLINERNIRCQGYRRGDGLWEVEATLQDVRTYVSPSVFREPVAAGAPFHSMAVRLAVNDQREVREIEVSIDSHPFPECPTAAPNFQRLIGLRLGAGFQRELQARVGGEAGCTHVLTLITNVANVVMQTLASQLRWDDRETAVRIYGATPEGVPSVVGSCRGYARNGEAVRRAYPEFYQPTK